MAAPVITTTANQSVVEGDNNLNVALTPRGAGITWAIAGTTNATGGVDRAKFRVSGASGSLAALRWATDFAPDFEAPTDSGANNVYNVTLRATTDADGTSSTIAMAITVTNLNENGAPPITPTTATYQVQEGVAWAQSFSCTHYPVTWSLLGTDAAKFTLTADPISGTGTTLGLAGKDYEAPDDANADHIYNVTLRCTNAANVTTDLPITVEVTNNTADDPIPGATGFANPTSHTLRTAGITTPIGWTNPANAYADDGAYALNAANTDSLSTSGLRLRGFNFGSLPDDAVITGIQVNVEYVGGGSGSKTIALKAQLVQSASDATANSIGTLKTVDAAVDRTTPLTLAPVGGAGDTWGLTTAQLMGSAFKSNFAVELTEIMAAGSGAPTCSIDYVAVRLFYSSRTKRHCSALL